MNARITITALLLTASAHAQPDQYSLGQKVRKLAPADVCVEAGRVLRRTKLDKASETWADVVLQRAQTENGLEARDHGYIRERRLRIGMHGCSVLAALGYADHVNRTVTAYGTRDQLVYKDKRHRYVYLEDDRVTAWQE